MANPTKSLSSQFVNTLRQQARALMQPRTEDYVLLGIAAIASVVWSPLIGLGALCGYLGTRTPIDDEPPVPIAIPRAAIPPASAAAPIAPQVKRPPAPQILPAKPVIAPAPPPAKPDPAPAPVATPVVKPPAPPQPLVTAPAASAVSVPAAVAKPIAPAAPPQPLATAPAAIAKPPVPIPSQPAPVAPIAVAEPSAAASSAGDAGEEFEVIPGEAVKDMPSEAPPVDALREVVLQGLIILGQRAGKIHPEFTSEIGKEAQRLSETSGIRAKARLAVMAVKYKLYDLKEISDDIERRLIKKARFDIDQSKDLKARIKTNADFWQYLVDQVGFMVVHTSDIDNWTPKLVIDYLVFRGLLGDE